MLKIYADRAHYAREYRAWLMPLLRPFWKDHPFTASQREEMYGPFVNDIELVNDLSKADIAVLPMNWLHYYQSQQLPQAKAFVAMAQAANKAVISWNGGDYTVPVPVEDVYVFAANGYGRWRRPLQFALPAFFNDPLQELAQADITIRSWQERPVIGFCGQANDTILQKTAKPLAIFWKNLKFHLGLSYFEPHSLTPPTRLRAHTLSLLERSPLLDTQFIKRRRYRGGKTKPREIMRQEFLNNIQQTDYTICVRGTGNYSQRLYETLALGRIPIFINTDCILPYDQQINWRDYCIWIEQDELTQLPQKIADFHHQLNKAQFQARQRECRNLWLDRLSFAGFHAHFSQYFLT